MSYSLARNSSCKITRETQKLASCARNGVGRFGQAPFANIETNVAIAVILHLPRHGDELSVVSIRALSNTCSREIRGDEDKRREKIRARCVTVGCVAVGRTCQSPLVNIDRRIDRDRRHNRLSLDSALLALGPTKIRETREPRA